MIKKFKEIFWNSVLRGMVMFFQVKLMRTGKQSKMTLSVDIPHGKLYAVKPSKESLDPNSIFTHDRSIKTKTGKNKFRFEGNYVL
jgi:hypothetical protein